MAQIVKLRRSSVTGNKPTTSQLELGELAMNTYDGKIYFEKSGSTGESIEEILTTNTQISGSLIISGSSHQITGSLELSGSLKLPSTVRDYTNSTGSVGQVLQVTENGAVWVDNVSTNTGDGRTAKQTFTSATTWSFNHNLNEQYPVIELYDSNNQVIIPSTITASTANNLVITFAVPVAGTAVATVGGMRGYQGNQGPQGANGYVGADGAQGAQGNQGPTGLQGAVGAQGNQGPTGAQGNQGPTGMQGDTGAQGNQGPIGFQGNQGLTGLQGLEGPQGNQGPTGIQGATGAQGNQGPTGLQGIIGAQGNQGPQGDQGVTGAQGAVSSSARNVNLFTATNNQTTFTVPGGYTVGLVDVFWNGVKQTVGVDYTASNGTTVVLANGAAAGDTIEIDNYLGEIGSQGNQGVTGPQGATGPQGSAGIAGAQGNQGPTGAQGANGFVGVDGAQGSQGNQGPIGLQGSIGAQGNQGPTGFQGAIGFQGSVGDQGAQGPTGAQGNQGPIGFQGNQGAQGIQGSADTSVRVISTFTATSGQTTFTVSGGYTVGLVDVYINGVKSSQSDYTATDGTTVILTTGTSAGNIVEITKYVGAIGSQGNQGSTGPQGAVGNQGSVGAQGITGAQGNQGPTGVQGTQGTAGSLDAVARTGDTMTGALNGTSATFSSYITANGHYVPNTGEQGFATLNGSYGMLLNGALGYVALMSGGNETIYLSNTGKVGIGNTSPDRQFVIGG